MNNLRFPLAGALALAATIFCAFFFAPVVLAQRGNTAPGVKERMDESQTVSLPGDTPRFARGDAEENGTDRNGTDMGPVDANTRLEHMILLLKPAARQQAELDALLAAQQDPGSTQYHHWLTPEQFGARFGANTAGLARLTAWLQSHGFSVDEVSPSRQLLTFSGTAAQVEEAFHVPIHRFHIETEQASSRIANARDPEIPAALSSIVAGIVSLNDQRRQPMLRAPRPLAARPEWNLYGEHYLYPADLAAIYNVNPLYASGTDGAGQSIAIAGRSNILLSDVAAFRAAAVLDSTLAAQLPTVLVPGGDPGLVNGDQDEATLDVEWAGAVAPAAQVTLVAEASTSTTDGIDLASAYIVNHAVASIVSVSFGECEPEMGASELAFYNSLWKQAAAQGMSVLVASGDAGAAGCDAGSAAKGTEAAVNGLCSSAYATCVGGTGFDEGTAPGQYWSATNGAGNASALGYIPETAWNESAKDGGTGLWATGGGVSMVYAQPAWQADVPGTQPANGMRAVPDVSLTAAAHDGYVIHENGSNWIVSGTSAATPAFAAILSLVNQSQGAPQGNANPRLYTLAKEGSSLFHPTGSGDNSVPGIEGFSATGETYNLATGLGSVDAAALAEAWNRPPMPIATPQPVGNFPALHGGPVQSPRALSFANPR